LVPYSIPGSESSGSVPKTPLFDSEAIQKDIQELKKLIPSKNNPTVSLSGKTLSVVHQKVFANNKELLLGHLLKLEKKEYLEKFGEGLTEVEKDAVKKEPKSSALEGLKKLIQK
jgi:hypothetical protein